jgi:2-polyprenyl-3-methyl-5-hydroxy-6-metoxy-1,4-benzoquinol methylase
MTKEEIFRNFRKRKIAAKGEKILELCSGKSVLDVGCVGQDCNYDNPDWLHNRVRGVSREITGTDIDLGGLELLRQRGFNMIHSPDLANLNKKFEVILMSDVIEHVDGAVSFLSSYSRYLADGGIIVITTPNAHAIRNFTGLLIRNDYSVNGEHTAWFCPKTLTEVVMRAGLKFSDFYWMKEYFRFSDVRGLKFRFIYILNKLFMRLRPGFFPNFMYIVTK